MREDRLPCDVIYYDDPNPQLFDELFLNEMWNKWKIHITVGLGMPLAEYPSKYYSDLEQHGFLMTDASGKPYHYRTDEIEADVANIDFFSKDALDFVFDDVWKPSLSKGGQFGMVDFGELTYVPDPKTKFWPSIHRDVYQMHNIYSLVYAEGLIDRGAQYLHGRKVGFMRPGFAGSQRVGWTWTCDSLPQYEDFQAHLRGAINLTLSGFATVGNDIGGWDSKGADSLYARWFTAGMYYPFAWSHGQGDHEPYSHGKKVEYICRTALERRYRLVPYLYTLNYDSSQTGIPMLRSLAMETNCEPGTSNIGDEYFLGPWMLVAPVVTGQYHRRIFLPAGTWIDYNDPMSTIVGPLWFNYDAPLDRVPVFIKAGAIIPMGPVMQYTAQKLLSPLTLDIYPSSNSSFTLFEDDGISLKYQDGDFATTTFRCARHGQNVTVTVMPRDTHGGSYRPPERDYVLQVHCKLESHIEPRVDGMLLPKVSTAELLAGKKGWAVDESSDVLYIRFTDTANRISVST